MWDKIRSCIRELNSVFVEVVTGNMCPIDIVGHVVNLEDESVASNQMGTRDKAETGVEAWD